MTMRQSRRYRQALVLSILAPLTLGCAALAQSSAKINVVPAVGHSSNVTSLAFSQDGRFVLSGGNEGLLKLWESDTGRLIRTFEGHTSFVNAVAFSPDGTYVLSGSYDHTVKLWETSTGALVHAMKHAASVESVTFSNNGRLVASGSRDGVVQLWELATGRHVRSFEFGLHLEHLDFGPTLSALSFSPDDQQIVAGGDAVMRLWNVSTGGLVHDFTQQVRLLNMFPSDQVRRVSTAVFVGDGKRIITGTGQLFNVWEVATGNLVSTFGRPGGVGEFALSHDGRLIAAGDPNGSVGLWGVTSQTFVRSIDAHADGLDAIAFSPDDDRIVVSDLGSTTFTMWKITGEKLDRSFGAPLRSVESVAFSSGGSIIVSGGQDALLRVWDARTGEVIRRFGKHAGAVEQLAITAEDHSVVTAAKNEDVTEVRIWNLDTGQLINKLPGTFEQVALSRDGHFVATGEIFPGQKHTEVKLWDMSKPEEAKLLRAVEQPWGNFLGLGVSADGRQLAASGFQVDVDALMRRFGDPGGAKPEETNDNKSDIRLYNVGDGKLTYSLPVRAFSPTFFPDGKRLALVEEEVVGQVGAPGGLDFKPSLTLRETTSPGKLVRSFAEFSGLTNTIAISPDERFIVLSSGFRRGQGEHLPEIKLWDAATGEPLHDLVGHSDLANSVAFSNDGELIVTGSLDATVKIWGRESGRLFATLLATQDGEQGPLKDQSLAIIPEGFFAASSPAASPLLSVVRGVHAVGIDQIWQSLFDPDLVRAKLAGDPEKEVESAAAVVSLEKVLDSGLTPAISISSPGRSAEAATDLIDAEAVITDMGGGIGRIEWRVNGITAGVETPPSGTVGSVTVKRKLALDPGDNTIEVVAYNGRNLLASLPTQTLVKWPGTAATGKGQLYVLAVGIDTYNDTKFRPLHLAANDARALGAALEVAGKDVYASVHVVPALDADATPAKLDTLIDDMGRDITPRDTFILFAAGHGTSENGRFYLIPYGYSSEAPGTLAEKAIGQDRLQDWVANRIKARKALILLDTCESGALVGGHGKSRTDAPASEAAVGRLHEATGRPVLTAAASGKAAIEGYKQHGIFTWAVLDALKNGDTNGNGTIELSELAAHVQDLVPKLSTEMRANRSNGDGQNQVDRAALTVPMPEDSTRFAASRQSARFGSRGENFVVARTLH